MSRLSPVSPTTTVVGAATSPLFGSPRPPFDGHSDPSADLILRSNDDVGFHVRRSVLELASPTIADLLGTGNRQPGERTAPTVSPGASASASASAHATPGIATVKLQEKSSVLDRLLRMCYPVAHRPFVSLDELQPVIHAAHKYRMQGVMEDLEARLLEFADMYPLRVYAIAIRYEMQDETVRTAARHFLAHPWKPSADLIPEIELINAGAYVRLLVFRSECVQTLQEMCTSLEWLPHSTYTFMECEECERDEDAPRCRLRHGNRTQQPVRWFWHLYVRLAERLKECPVSDGLSDPALIGDAVRAASRCEGCSEVAFDQLLSFMSQMKTEVDCRLAKCKLAIL
ncbi:hypothetical protein OH77DRAFT_1428686 [Trametes cingulata]|nr:hypothetical protein OH77DRAFT_1428686 [Trametes cingulata]